MSPSIYIYTFRESEKYQELDVQFQTKQEYIDWTGEL